MGPGKPGETLNFIVAFSRAGKSWKKSSCPVLIGQTASDYFKKT